MKRWIKRAAAAAPVIAGVLLFVGHVRRLLDWPHLYPDLGQLGVGNLLFLGLTLLFVAFAWVAASYLLLNTHEGALHRLIPAAAFVLLLTLGGLCVTRAVGKVPCSYTTSLAACREEFDAQRFRVRGQPLYPEKPEGEVSSYASYEKGEVLAEQIVRAYDQQAFTRESARLAALGLPVFQLNQNPREREAACYELRLGDALWQILVVPKTKTVTYSRFNRPDQLPSFAPRPTEAPETQGRIDS